jgi:glycosyltransferase involved in cell wall biosynthesis
MSSTAAPVSVVIPTYNRQDLLGRAIESVLKQTVPVSEIIVIDDGSTDATRELARAYRDSIRYVYQENRGTAAARNRGIRESRFQWVAFLDHDDEWLPEQIALQLHALAQGPQAVLCYGSFVFFGLDGAIRTRLCPEPSNL